MRHPLPPHHDDHHGGPDGHPAHRHGLGAGAESRRPLGLGVVGGLLFSQLITLYITPVYYIYLDSFQKWMQGHFGRKKPLNLKGEPLMGNGAQEVGSRQF